MEFITKIWPFDRSNSQEYEIIIVISLQFEIEKNRLKTVTFLFAAIV